MFVIVPNHISEEINRLLDNAFLEYPEATKEREAFYHQILEFYDNNGCLPEFTIQKVNK